MKLSEIKKYLSGLNSVNFELENGKLVPENFHVTEVGITSKHFIDCGGKVRDEKLVNFQLWDSNDFDHRLKPQKLLDIIGLSEKVLGIENLEIEVEYQTNTIGKYDLDFNGKNFILKNKQTDCLASDHCGINKEVLNTIIIESPSSSNTCTPGGGCC